LRGYILSPHERKLIKRYLETGDKLEGFKVLLHRLRKQQINPEVIQEDLQLIKELLEKTETQKENTK
jgi:hypothetical protein